MKKESASALAIMLAGFVAAGCAGGNGRMAVAPVAATAAGATSAGQHGWTTAAVGTDPAAGVAALFELPTGEALLAEGRRVWRVGLAGELALEAGLEAGATSFAAVGTDLFLATGDPGLPGAGDVLARTQRGWELALAGEGREALVGVAGGRVHAVVGEEGAPAKVHVLAEQGWLVSGRLPGPGAPSALAAFGQEVWVAVEEQGRAALFRRSRSSWEEVPLPLAPRSDARQRVTALVGTPERLLIALAELDRATGRPLGGQVLAWNGSGLAPLQGMMADAPLALVVRADGPWIGSASGRLLHAGGATALEESLPDPAQAIGALAAGQGNALLVGVTTRAGTALLRRLDLNAARPVVPSATPAAPEYARDVKPILAARCAGCHERSSGFRLSPGLADDAADLAALRALVDPASPGASRLLRKAANEEQHRGGKVLEPAGVEFATLLAWIGAGAAGAPAAAAPPATTSPVASASTSPVASGGFALLPGGTAPVASGGVALPPAGTAPVASGANPGAPPVQTQPLPVAVGYRQDAKPVLAARCAGCHSRRSSFRVSQGMTDDAADYQAVLQRVDLTNPERSPLLVRATGGLNHPVTVLDPTLAEYQALLRWIAGGAPFTP